MQQGNEAALAHQRLNHQIIQLRHAHAVQHQAQVQGRIVGACMAVDLYGLRFCQRSKLAKLAPDGAFHEVQVCVDLPDTQALSFDHLNDLELKTRVKGSSGFLILHVLRHLVLVENLSLCPLKSDHHTGIQVCFVGGLEQGG